MAQVSVASGRNDVRKSSYELGCGPKRLFEALDKSGLVERFFKKAAPARL